jgi:hypothetical protein
MFKFQKKFLRTLGLAIVLFSSVSVTVAQLRLPRRARRLPSPKRSA